MNRFLLTTLTILCFFHFSKAQKFVGIASGGGAYHKGTIFQYDIQLDSFSVLHSFDSTVEFDWIFTSGLVEGKNGNLYGVEEKDSGSIFEFDLNSSTFKKVIKFNDKNVGIAPSGSLSKNSDSTFIGVCEAGGIHGLGTVFSFNTVTGQVRKLVDFDSVSRAPSKGLEHIQGDEYLGSSPIGGIYNEGALLKVNIKTGQVNVLLNFSDSITGSYPYAKPKIASDGNVFIPTYNGKKMNWGQFTRLPSVVKYDLSQDTLISSLVYYEPSFGSSHKAQFIEVDSVLYTVSSINSHVMRIFVKDSMDRVPYIKIPFSIGEADEIMLATDRLLYGTTNWGGTNGTGTIFSYDPQTDSIKLLHDFDFSEGYRGKSKLIELSECAGVDRTIGYAGEGLISGESNATYQWIDCNSMSAIQGASNQTFIPQDTGSFAVVVQKGNCVDTSWCIRVITVGAKEHDGVISNLELFPNPTNGQLQLQFTKAENVEVFIRNLQGQLISTQSFSNQKQLTIELEGNAGVYFLEIKNEIGERVYKKIVKQ